jgi:hypothetical protein
MLAGGDFLGHPEAASAEKSPKDASALACRSVNGGRQRTLAFKFLARGNTALMLLLAHAQTSCA